ncbi:NAD-binding protein [Paraburkholderia tropica]|uniref:NAD-binding protein n=1 Tax=Paraburkholderia tropica TaxID=92647 RepID=UPI003017EBDF
MDLTSRSLRTAPQCQPRCVRKRLQALKAIATQPHVSHGMQEDMVACNEGILEDVSQIRQQFCKIVPVEQEPGQAQAAKLENNLLSMTALAVTSEAMVLGAKLHICGQTPLDIINASSGRNTATPQRPTSSPSPC